MSGHTPGPWTVYVDQEAAKVRADELEQERDR